MLERSPAFIKARSRQPEVLLVAPPSMDDGYIGEMKKKGATHTIPPLGTVSVATYLNENSIPTRVLDVEKELLTTDETVDKILEIMPDGGYVGFAGWINNIHRGAEIARRLKEKSAKHGTFVGGPHPSAVPMETMQKYHESFDYAVGGEAEISTTDLIKNWGNEEKISKIAGIIYKSEDGPQSASEPVKLGFVKDTARGYTRAVKDSLEHGSYEHRIDLVTNNQIIGEKQTNLIAFDWPAKSARVEDVNDLPIPDYSLLGDLRRYHLSEFTPPAGEFQVTMWTARGCPFACYFCDQEVSGHTWRGMAPEKIVDYMLYLKSLGADYLYNTDDLYLVKLDWVEESARRILDTPGLRGIRWEAITRPNLVNRAAEHKVDYKGRRMNLLELVYEAGCRQLHIGVESGNEQLRANALGKRLTNKEIEESILHMKRAGISVKTLNMVGAPGETPEQTLETLQFVKRMGDIGADWAMVAVCTPLPTTPLALLIEDGRLKWTGDLHNWKKMDMWNAAGIFTTDIRGNSVEFTPREILHLARGKFRLGSQVKPVDIKEGRTIETAINRLQTAIDIYNDGKKISLPIPEGYTKKIDALAK